MEKANAYWRSMGSYKNLILFIIRRNSMNSKPEKSMRPTCRGKASLAKLCSDETDIGSSGSNF